MRIQGFELERTSSGRYAVTCQACGAQLDSHVAATVAGAWARMHDEVCPVKNRKKDRSAD